ncbi:phosphotransferase enzyme family protein [Streptomyces sp. V4I2]|uniref:phosphotransferase enzyme family protein n=1 Tax=Streptomyces sp. V4I2 TaxID=3042280 RepID=UPI002780B7C9|nr:phosphotransferase [Streptomyces sp. V4I2]MDQ1041978.1 Ser/Thr protein kinase RdoA (MazF antagonist) [Streptomyces sp. V4I2]
MTSFSRLPHATQLDRLEEHTRAALTQHYGLDGAAARMEVQQYEDNAVWRVTPPGQKSYVARLSVRDGRPAHQQRSEMRWLESLAASRTVAVPEPVTTTGGHYVVPLEVPGHDEPSTLALLHWLPGTAEPPYRQPGVAEQMGSTTAYLHEHAATVPLPEFDRPVWDAETILLKGHALTDPAAREQLGAEGTDALRKVAESITPALHEGGPEDRGRIHGDLHRENMIALPGGGIGVIDFDDCGTGHYLLDIATVLSSVHRIARKEPGAYQKFARDYLAGYTQVRPLPADFARLLEPYLLLRDVFILNFVTTAAPVNAGVASWGPARIAGIVAHMQAYVEGDSYPGAFAPT